MHNPGPSESKPFRRWRLEWFLLIALLTIAFSASGLLLFLKARHDRETHVEATALVLQSGEALLDVLCDTDLGLTKEPSAQQWGSYSDRIDSIFAVRKDVQSVSISRNGVTVFHRQANRMDLPASPSEQGGRGDREGETLLSRGTLDIGGRSNPVFLLTRTRPLPDGGTVVTEAAVRREAVGEEENTAKRAMASLFAFSLAVLILSFLLCAVVLTLAIIRDRKRERRARQEEHLAFSGVLANGILHDFRNPMSAVRLDAQMLGREMKRPDGFRPQRVTDLSERIARTMARMDKIFQEFLFLAKPADERPEPLDIADVLRESLDTLAPRLEQAGLTARLDPELEAPLWAEAFATAFRRALINVLVNAIHFSPPGGEITLTLSGDGERVTLDIHDEGPGIPPKMREKIFEMFITGRPEGTGLGLFLARTAIERCGGEIRVADSPSGTTLRIRLRATQPPSETKEKQP